ncbi:hypothetical protein GQ457_01G052630 [Hibiscus cannabinus]
MSFDHRVAKERVVWMRPNIEQAAGVVDGGKRGKGTAGRDELSENIKVGFDGVTEHESMDLEESSFRGVLLEEKHAFFLRRTPY